MRHYFTILSHEIRTLLYSASTYIAAVLFLVVMAFIFTAILETYATKPQEISPAAVFFQYFWLPVLFMVPLLTMRSFAEERRQGTLETLLTTPVTTTEVVLGKFSAAYLFYLSLWASTLAFHYLLFRYARDAHFADPGPLIGGYLFIAVSGLLFVAIGIFASTLTRAQSVAGVVCFAILVALIVGFNYLGELPLLNQEVLSPVKAAVDAIQVFRHADDFTRGIVDLREVFFYLTGATLALIFSILGVEAKILNS